MQTPAQQTWVKTAQILGYLGVLPFLFALLTLFIFDNVLIHSRVINAVSLYSAVILTFVSAVHWGVILKADTGNQSKQLTISVLPSLIAWVLLLVPQQIALAGFFFCFIGWLQYEKINQQYMQLPDWYQLLRKQLSYIVAGLILLIWLVNLNSQ